MTNADLPAMPVPGLHGDEDFNGLSKRELFAAMAMQGLLAGGADKDFSEEVVSKLAAANADALLAELERTE